VIFKEYRRAWDKAHRVTPPVPLNADIELSAVCNLACPFCFLADPTHKQDKRFMDLDLAIRTINEAHKIGVPALKFNWRGEGTLNPNFTRIVEYAASLESFHELLLNTNGNFGEQALDGVLACTKVMYSLDSAREDTYKQIRIGGDLLKILGNISKTIKGGHKNIWVRRVVTDLNKHEDFKGDVRRLFGNDVKVSEHYVFERAKKGQKRPSKRLYCGYPSQRLVVAVDGKVYPCCVDYDCTMMMGVAPDLMGAWKSPRMEALRRTLKVGALPKTCQNCTSWMSYSSPKRKHVKDKEI
jgi:radical SAM protein with 4Fe4S-binding SPASM domain